MKNNFDKMAININEIFLNKKFRKKNKHYNRSLFIRFVFRMIVAFSYKFNIYTRLVNSGIILSWFYEFKEYWSEILKGRPLYLNDFYFLLGIYRMKYQNVSVEKDSSFSQFLKAWQNDDSLYQLFGAIRRFSTEPIFSYRYEKWISNGDSILEYGCGIAPLANSLLKYSLKSKLKITIAEIKQINSHFAKWRLGENVKFIEISSFNNNLTDKYDKIFLITVLEHLPNPLDVIKEIKNSLKNKGLLIFDYIISEGKGLDTLESLNERENVLNYIKENFNLIFGEINFKKSMGTTVVQIK